jgi:hypothetical protein
MNPTILSLLSTEALRGNHAAKYLRDETIYALARPHAARTPDRFVIRDQFRRLAYRELVDHG